VSLVPICRHPNVPEFFVYAFVANGYPFYVGIGRLGRATDRIRYVRYLMERERQGRSVKWVASCRVIATLIRRGMPPELQLLVSGVVRAEALLREKEIIRQFLREGRLLANRQHAGGSSVTVEQVVAAVLREGGVATP
jgi:hypothetical protein